MLLGAHESISGGWHKAIGFGLEDGCDAIQIFTKNQNQWHEPMPDDAKAGLWKKAWEESGIRAVVSHNSYLVNLASPEDELFEKSVVAMIREVERSNKLGIPAVVIHPGSHKGSGEEKGLSRVAQGLGRVHAETPAHGCAIALEITAGQGASLGYRFEHFSEIIGKTQGGDRLRVCFDTCHAFAAGYDLASKKGYEATWKAFEDEIGLDRLCAMHLNDAKKGLGSRVDRHERIGLGVLGLEPFRLLVNDPRFDTVPGLLETPPVSADDRGYREGLETLRRLQKRRKA